MDVSAAKANRVSSSGKAAFLCLFTYFMVVSCLFAVTALMLEGEAQISVANLRKPYFYAAPAALTVFFLAIAAFNRKESKPIKERK
jgi:hypothetical protein